MRIKTGLFITMIFFTACGRSPESFKLEHKYRKGREYKYSYIENALESEKNQSGSQRNFKIDKTLVLRERVSGISRKAVDIELELIAVNVRQGSGDTGVGYNSQDNKQLTADHPFKYMQQLKDSVFSLKQGRNGEFSDIELSAGNASGKINQPYLCEVIRKSLPVACFPAKRIKPGESWQYGYVLPLPLKGKDEIASNKVYLTYQLKGRKQIRGIDCLEIHYQGEVTPERSDSNQAGLEVFIVGTIRGKIYFDYANGIVIEQTEDVYANKISKIDTEIEGKRFLKATPSQIVRSSRWSLIN